MGEFRSVLPTAQGSSFKKENFDGENPPKDEQFITASLHQSNRQQPDIETVRKEALEEGISIGADRVRDELSAEMANLQQELEKKTAYCNGIRPLYDEIDSLRRQALVQAAADVGQLVLALSRRVVGDSLAYNPEALPKLVENAIAQMPEEDEILIHVAPDDVECVKDSLSEKMRDQVVANPELEAGCIIETQYASIDSSLDAVLEGIESAVNTWLESQE